MEYGDQPTKAFVALDLPTHVREGITAWGAEQLADPALRPVPIQNLHMTLAFLGWLGPREIELAASVVHGFEASGVPLRLERDPVAVRARGGIRLFALNVLSAHAAEVQAEIEEELVAAAVYESEERLFWPHVTVARVRNEKGKRRRLMRVEGTPEPLPAALCEQTFAVRLTLYRSKTKSAGVEYTPLAQVELPQTGSGEEADG